MIQRLHISIHGAVQGVGFRPFVHRLASELRLAGWVLNSPQGVSIEVEGDEETLRMFLLRLEQEKPDPAFIQSLEFFFLDPAHFGGFEIRRSNAAGAKTTLVLPDIATCRQCLGDVMNPGNRRYRYPFTNCTHCGPRYTIIEALPYDRSHTSMKRFEMCSECRREYENPADRRFHAQPNACPACGPWLELWRGKGEVQAAREEALLEAVRAIRSGQCAAVKGLGGFHLVVDARNDDAVSRLRRNKRREEKPLALMFPSLEPVKQACHVSPLEERLLSSSESPIVLLHRRGDAPPGAALAPSVAPRNPYLGVMLPYTPLHHILMMELRHPVVATSANLSEEPICTDEHEAVARLGGVADLYLVHNRPIVRHVDDSIVRVMMDRELVLRRARGYAPLPVRIQPSSAPVLAVGGHLKNTVALARERDVFLSQHIGDLENSRALEAFRSVIADLGRMYDVKPQGIAADMHPDYMATKYAGASGARVFSVQHHFAHVASCMAENRLEGPVLGVAWDGTGYGPDGTIWGGEFLSADNTSFRRVACFRPFRLPGGASAIREPRRAALGALFEIYGPQLVNQHNLQPLQACSPSERDVLSKMLAKGVNSPLTSSAGRLFDVVASVLGLRQIVRFEGQAAMELEFAIGDEGCADPYPFALMPDKTPGSEAAAEGLIWVDWQPILTGILDSIDNGTPVGVISARFHNTLGEVIIRIAKRAARERVLLTGGCFQNRYLTEYAVRRLTEEGFRPYWHQRVPPNDGGIALGQAAVAAYLFQRS